MRLKLKEWFRQPYSSKKKKKKTHFAWLSFCAHVCKNIFSLCF